MFQWLCKLLLCGLIFLCKAVKMLKKKKRSYAHHLKGCIYENRIRFCNALAFFISPC